MARVVDEVLQTLDQAQPAGVDDLLQRRRVADDGVARRHAVDDQRGQEARPLLVERAQVGRADELVDALPALRVDLHQAAMEEARLPGGVGEALVLGIGGDGRLASDDVA
jgi:hypothetical protein